jgi:CSLREA domain-containing protein
LFSQSDEPVRAGGVLIFVDTTEDLPATDGNCSLREAIMAANANSNVDNCMANLGGFDQIEFNLGGGTPVINIGATDLPDITAPLVIEGGAGRVELRGPGGSFQDGHNGLTSRRLR